MTVTESFHGQLGPYRVVTTADGAPTIYSEFFGEHCHSLSGSRQETQKFYLENTGILEAKGTLTLLEVGTGPGLGLEMTLEALSAKLLTGQVRLTYVGLELDPDLFTFGILKFPHLEKLIWTRHQLADLDFFLGLSAGVSVMILIGDARKTLPKFTELYPTHCFSFIYQDPFSPKKNSSLWTVEWFNQLKKISHPEVVLSTYSSSSAIRLGLKESGWSIFDGGGLGKKWSSTVAKLQGESCPEMLMHLQRSPLSALSDHGAAPISY